VRNFSRQNESHHYRATWWDRLELSTRLMRHSSLVGKFFGSDTEEWTRAQQEGINWETLRTEYPEAVCDRY